MKSHLLTLALCALAFSNVSSAAPVAVTGPIQWSTGSGGNGHTYQLFFDNATGGGIAWTAADAYATSIGGHLVTLTSSAEEAFVNSTFNPSMPIGSGNAGGTCCPHYWIGLYSPSANGVYQWVTGETLSYTNYNPSEPNNPATEPYFADRWQGAEWNNLPNTAFSPASYFVVENSVPEPGSMALLGAGALVLIWRRRRS